MPKGGKKGYVYIRREGLAYAAWLSVHGSGRQRELAAELISYILERAREGARMCIGRPWRSWRRGGRGAP